jgi:hypothetical protein
VSDAPKQEAQFRLELNDRHSPTWAKLRRHLEARITELRRQNDSDADPMKTAKLRGRIAELKGLLSLGNPASAEGEESAD